MNIVNFKTTPLQATQQIKRDNNQPNIAFKGNLTQDTFVKSKPSAQETVTFTGGSAKKIYKAIPESKELAQKVAQGNIQALDDLNKAINKALSEEKIKKIDLSVFNSKLADNLLNSAIQEPTDGKAQNIVKTNLTNRLVITYLNEYHDYAEAAGKIFGDHAMKKHSKNMAKQLKAINSVLSIENKSVRADGRAAVKKSLTDTIYSYRASINIKNRAMQMFLDANLVNNRENLKMFEWQVKEKDYSKHNQLFAIKCLPAALNQCLKHTKPEEVRDTVIRSINTLGHVLKQEGRPRSQKEAAHASLRKVLSNGNIPAKIREELVKNIYDI